MAPGLGITNILSDASDAAGDHGVRKCTGYALHELCFFFTRRGFPSCWQISTALAPGKFHLRRVASGSDPPLAVHGCIENHVFIENCQNWQLRRVLG
jgi:hypothetical protein